MERGDDAPAGEGNESAARAIRVFVLDDHAIVRDGLRRLIEDTPDLAFAGCTGDGNEALRALPTAAWDVLVLDLSLPSRGGVEVLRQARALRPALAVVVLSAYPESQYAARVLRAGASAYVPKGRPTAELIDAIRRAASAAPGAASPPAAPPAPRAPHDALSAREHQVFTLLAQGKSPGEVASDLNLSFSTVSTHIANVRRKLGAQTVGEIVQYAFRAGILP